MFASLRSVFFTLLISDQDQIVSCCLECIILKKITHLFPDLVVKYWMFTVTVLFLCLMFCDQDQVVSCCFKWGGNWMFQIFWNVARWIYRWCLLTYFHSLSDKLKSSRYNLFQSVMGANRFKNFLTKRNPSHGRFSRLIIISNISIS